MPYIKMERRKELANEFTWPENAGELNYILTKILINAKDEDEVYTKTRYVVNTYMLLNGHNYQNMNDVFGALVGSEREYERRMGLSSYRNVMGLVLDIFYRHIAAPYENFKIMENGDVYDKKENP